MVRLTLTVRKNLLPGLAGRVRAGVRTGLERAREPLLEDMKRRTPVDEGRLRASERAEVNDTTLTLRAGGGDVNYSVYVHQGTRRVPPRRYMAEAMEQGVPRIVAAIEDGIRSEIG